MVVSFQDSPAHPEIPPQLPSSAIRKVSNSQKEVSTFQIQNTGSASPVLPPLLYTQSQVTWATLPLSTVTSWNAAQRSETWAR